MFVNTYSQDDIIVAWGWVGVNWWIVQNEPKIFVHCTEKEGIYCTISQLGKSHFPCVRPRDLKRDLRSPQRKSPKKPAVLSPGQPTGWKINFPKERLGRLERGKLIFRPSVVEAPFFRPSVVAPSYEVLLSRTAASLRTCSSSMASIRASSEKSAASLSNSFTSSSENCL